MDIAPGECKIPTNVLRDEHWDTEGWPHLHPTGKFGLHHPRQDKISAQDYFLQRIMNIDKRWSTNKSYLFAALNFVERLHLEKQISSIFFLANIQSFVLSYFFGFHDKLFVDDDQSSDLSTDSEDVMAPVRAHQHDLGGETVLVDNYPEASIYDLNFKP